MAHMVGFMVQGILVSAKEISRPTATLFLCLSLHLCVYIYIYTHIYILRIHTYIYIYTCIGHMRIYIHIYTHIYTPMHTLILMCTYICGVSFGPFNATNRLIHTP